MKVVRYLQSFFHVAICGYSEAKYEAGKVYAQCEETLRHIEHGIAELFDAPDDVDKAQAAAEKAEAAASKANDAASDARQTAGAAAAAAALKTDANT
jgi:hypothetical protein